jgi:hypothetical protein
MTPKQQKMPSSPEPPGDLARRLFGDSEEEEEEKEKEAAPAEEEPAEEAPAVSEAETLFYDNDGDEAEELSFSQKDLVALAMSFTPAPVSKKRKEAAEAGGDEAEEMEEAEKMVVHEDDRDEAQQLAEAVTFFSCYFFSHQDLPFTPDLWQSPIYMCILQIQCIHLYTSVYASTCVYVYIYICFCFLHIHIYTSLYT